MRKKLWRWIRVHKLVLFVAGVALAAGILQITKHRVIAHWILAIGSIIALSPSAWEMSQVVRYGTWGVNFLPYLAAITAILVKQYWVAIGLAAIVIVVAYAESRARSMATKEIDGLLNSQTHSVHVIRGHKPAKEAVSNLSASEKFQIMTNVIVPVDCVVLDGESTVVQPFHNDPLPSLVVKARSTILAGSKNIGEMLTVKALTNYQDSQYQQDLKLVRSASKSNSSFVRMSGNISLLFSILVIIIGALSWFISHKSIRFLDVLTVATPAMFLIGPPISFLSGLNSSLKNGIFMKNLNALDALSTLRCIAFDGNVFRVGAPVVKDVKAYNKHSESEILRLASSIAHQLPDDSSALAIVAEAEKRHIKSRSGKQITNQADHGHAGRFEGKNIMIGNLGLLQNTDISAPAGFKPDSFKQLAYYVAVDLELAAVITFTDPLRSEAKGMLNSLRKLRLRNFALVTSDSEPTAIAAAKELDIVDVYPECLPVDKLLAIENLAIRPVALVGDERTESILFSAADIGIQLASVHSATKHSTASVIIQGSNISRVADAVTIASRSLGIVKQTMLVGILISLIAVGIFATGKIAPIYGLLVQLVISLFIMYFALRDPNPKNALTSAKRSTRRR